MVFLVLVVGWELLFARLRPRWTVTYRLAARGLRSSTMQREIRLQALRRAGEMYSDWVLAQGRIWVGALTPRELERLVEALLRRDGHDAEQVGGSGDRGVDVRYKDCDGRLRIVQCKHRRDKAGGHDLVHFVGAIAHHGAAGGMFVSTGGFTREAVAIATEHGVRLVDDRRLVEWARRDGHVPPFMITPR